uniref:Cysteine peptidase 2 n=1 Tax=Babesia bovis TaxID=5865 RepID=C8CJZ6_BABBO|nr:cysteine peptidase 2 [Babesia bovis]
MEIPAAASDLSNLDDHYVRSDDEVRDTTLIGRSRRCCVGKKTMWIVLLGTAILTAAITSGIILLVTSLSGGKAKPAGGVKHIGKFDGLSRADCHVSPETFAELSSMAHLGEINVSDPAEIIKYMDFTRMAKKFDRKYDSVAERHSAFLNFRRNHDIVKSHEHNKAATYTKDLNHFFDKDIKAVAAKLLHKIDVYNESNISVTPTDTTATKENQPIYATLKNYSVSAGYPPIGSKVNFEDIDWRRADAVTPVKDQGMCGSCWAFAAVGSVESLLKRQKTDVRLSEQELVSCQLGNQGCNGGYSDYALNYIKFNGIHRSEEWPYLAADGKCVAHDGTKYYIKGYHAAKGRSVANQLLVMGPTVVYIAVSEDLMHYSGGVFNGECSDSELNHAVLLVGEGYDSTLKKRYWLLKNSWGTSWGEDGYFRLERTNTPTDKCGVLSYGYVPY